MVFKQLQMVFAHCDLVLQMVKIEEKEAKNLPVLTFPKC